MSDDEHALTDSNEHALTVLDPEDDERSLDELRRSLSHPKMRAFLVSFSYWGVMGRACRDASISRSVVLKWAAKDPTFAKAMELAKQQAIDRLEEEMVRRAVEGIEEPIYGKLPGKDTGVGIVGFKRVYSDTMLAMALNGANPQKYVRRMQVSGPDGGPIQVEPVTQRLATRLQAIVERRQALLGSGADTPSDDACPPDSK